MAERDRSRRRVLGALAAATGLSGCLRLATEEEPTAGPRTADASTRTPGGSTEPSRTEAPRTTAGDAGAPDAIPGAWRQFQFDAANTGHAPDAVGPKSDVRELWSASVDGEFGHDSATLADGTVYVKANGLEAVLAFDARTGEERWRTRVGGMRGAASPTAVAGTVWIGTESGTVVELAASDGRRVGRFEANAGERHYGVMCSVTARGERLFFGDDSGVVYCLDRGLDERWRFRTDGSIGRSTPAVADGTAYVGSTDGNLYALDAATGTEQWRASLADAVFTAPAVAGGTVYAGSITATTGENPVTDPDGDDIEESRETTGALHALSADDGSRLWTVEVDDQVNAGPAVAGGTVYAGPRNGPLYAFDAATGERQWFYPVDSIQEGSPAVADGVVYLASDRLYALDAGTGRELWSHETAEGMDTSPVVSEEVVFAGDHDGYLYAVSGETGR